MDADKRARQKANRQSGVAAQARSNVNNQRQQQRLMIYGFAALLLFGGILAVVFLTGGDDDEPASDDATGTTIDGFTDQTLPTTVPGTAPDRAPATYGTTPCPPVEGAADRTTQFDDAPEKCIEDGTIYSALISTTEGDITVNLDPDFAPLAVNNFVFLSRNKYYDGVAFHRIITEFMVQGGDAVGNPPGTGGPGYTFADELPAADYLYRSGELAMANSGPATNGSQFFIVTKDTGVDWLQGRHTPFGAVTEGLDVVDAIEALDSGDSTPSKPVMINSITITEA